MRTHRGAAGHLMVAGWLLLAGCRGGDTQTTPGGGDAEDTTGDEAPASLGLPNEHRISDEVLISGRPTAGQLRGLYAQGVRTVVRLHSGDAPDGDDERAILEDQGIRFVEFDVSTPNELVVDFAIALVDRIGRAGAAEGQTLLHCENGNISAAAQAFLQFLSGATVDEALASYDASGQSAWRDRLEERLRELCSQSLGGCAPAEPETPPTEVTEEIVGYPGLLPAEEAP